MGEEARSRGIEAENIAWSLINALGYEICDLPNEEYDIDAITTFNPSSPPNESLKRPRFSPEGLTAFEVTGQRITTKKFTIFKEKIDRYNEDHQESAIDGGILLTDESVSNTMYRQMREQDIFCWGSGRVVFYWQKIRISNSWRAFGTVTEVELDQYTSYLRCFSPSYEQIFRFAVFFDDNVHVLSPLKTRNIMERIREQSLAPFINQGLTPLNVWFEFHALSSVREDLARFLVRFISIWRNDKIIVFMPDDAFKGYRTFPALLL